MIQVIFISFVLLFSFLYSTDIDDLKSMIEQQQKEIDALKAEKNMPPRDSEFTRGYVVAELLFVKPRVSGTEYAYTDANVNAGFPVDGDVKQLHFGWDYGFKIGAGKHFSQNALDLYLQYSQFSSATNGKSDVSDIESLIPNQGFLRAFPDNDIITNCKMATSTFYLSYKGIDFRLGKNFQYFHPFFGVKAAHFKLKQKTQYNGGSVLIFNNTYHVDGRSNYWGVGPTFGVDAKLHLPENFAILGECIGSILYGNFRIKHKEFDTASQNKTRLNAGISRFNPVLSFKAGLVYDFFTKNKDVRVETGIFYQVEYFFRQNQMIKIDDVTFARVDRYNDDVSFHSINLGVRVDF